jgi:hypothetical protein
MVHSSEIINSIRDRYSRLKKWQKILLFSVVFFGILGSLGDRDGQVESSKSQQQSPGTSQESKEKGEIKGSSTNTASQVNSPSPVSSPSQEVSTSPQSPLEFRFSALRDLSDLRKDVEDAREGISSNGLGKFYWNIIEIEFNLTQLESLVPRPEYAKDWNESLATLKSAVSQLDPDNENLTISLAKRQLNDILKAIPPLEKIVKRLAN